MGCGCGTTLYSSTCAPKCGCSDCCTPKKKCSKICTSLIADNAWNIPACDAEAVLSFPGLSTILIGSYLTNPNYGSFLVTGFNSVNGEVTVQNTCLAGNQPPGTVVPAGTEFIFGQFAMVTEWTDYTPSVSGNGSMTVTATAVNAAKYFIIGTTAWLNLNIDFTIAGTPNTDIIVTFPFTGKVFDYIAGPASSVNGDGTAVHSRWSQNLQNSLIVFIIPSATNWAAGASGNLQVQGFIELDS